MALQPRTGVRITESSKAGILNNTVRGSYFTVKATFGTHSNFHPFERHPRQNEPTFIQYLGIVPIVVPYAFRRVTCYVLILFPSFPNQDIYQ